MGHRNRGHGISEMQWSTMDPRPKGQQKMADPCSFSKRKHIHAGSKGSTFGVISMQFSLRLSKGPSLGTMDSGGEPTPVLPKDKKNGTVKHFISIHLFEFLTATLAEGSKPWSFLCHCGQHKLLGFSGHCTQGWRRGLTKFSDIICLCTLRVISVWFTLCSRIPQEV